MSGALNEIERRVRTVLQTYTQLHAATEPLAGNASLYDLGMTSRVSVTVMLALEGEFEIEFPDAMLRRDVFESIDTITRAVGELLGGR